MSMKTVSILFAAGQQIDFEGGGNYFHVLEATANISVALKRNGAVISDALNVGYGFKLKPEGGFNGYSITSATVQTIKIGVGDGDGEFNQVTGTVSISGNTGAHLETQASVTNANNAILAANAARKYLFVQNNSAAGVLRLKTNGVAATATSGIRLQPGQSYEPVGFIPTGAINAFMETADATANNVEIIEG